MAFFHHPIFANSGASANPSFTPLFRLLDDFDNYSRQGQPHQGSRRTAVPTWTPKFDVRETADTYELHGELPGMSKENVGIEFSEPQTMVIRGRAERSYHVGNPPAAALEDTAMSGAITEGEEAAPKSPRSTPQKATVEDEKEAQTGETGWEDVSDKGADGNNNKSNNEVAEQQQKKPVDNAKYWLTERSIGEFSRTFNFPSRVENENVSASFKDGILSVVVPKAKKHEVRRVAIN
jgi:HSP20 family molecular chaperone IbpA